MMLGYYGFILGYILQHIGMITILIRLLSKKSKEWISIDSIACTLIATTVRFVVFFMFSDNMAIYKFECLVGIGLTATTLFFTWKRNELKDISSVSLPICYKYQVLVAVAAIFALILSPNVGDGFFYRFLTGFFIYLESISLVPQIYLIKKEGNIGGFTSLYITLVGCSRIFRLIFWIVLFIVGFQFLSLIVADALHTFLVGQLMYEYCKILKNSNILPFTEKRHIS